MSRAAVLAWRGRGATLAVQLWIALLAAIPSSLVGLLLEWQGPDMHHPAEWLESLARTPELALALATPLACSLLLYLLSLPAIQLAWMHALGRRDGGNLPFAFAHYLAAVRQSATIALVAASGTVALAAVPVITAAQATQYPEPQQRMLLAASTLPLGAWLLVCGAWHDLSRGDLVARGEGRLRNTLGLWTTAFHPRRLTGYTLQLLVTTGLSAGAVAALSRPDLAGLLLAQAALLARGFARSVWLADVMRLAEPTGPR